jgi:hypothetical protein
MPEGIPYASSNVVAGAGLELNYIGNHCYAFSGEFGTSGVSQTTLEFTTGKEYIIFKAYFTGPLKFSDPNTGREANWQVSLNGIIIANIHTDTTEADITAQGELEFLVPPFTNVLIELDGNDTDAAYTSCVVLTGTVYK